MQQTTASFGRGAVAALITGPKRDLFPEPANARTCVVVLGMHRSGTSVLAGTLGRLGVTLPSDLLGPFPGNPKGHFESKHLYAIHERMLAALHTAWYDIRPIGRANLNSDIAQQFEAELIIALKDIYNSASLFVLKDPRTCRFFPLCRSAIEAFGASPRVVFMLRNPLEVASSLRTRDRLSFSHALGLWLRHVLDAEHHSRGVPRVFIDYSKFLQDWRTAIDQIEQRLGIALPGRWTDAENAVDEFVEVGLRHETSSIDELHARFGNQGSVGPCYEAMTHLLRDPHDKDAMESLDLIRAALEEPARFFGGGIKEYYTEIEDLRRADATQKDQLECLRSTMASLQEIEPQRSADHAATLSVLEAERVAWCAERTVLEAEREAWRAERTGLTTRLEEAAQMLSQRNEALRLTQESLEEMRRRHVQLLESFSEQVAAVGQLRATLMIKLKELEHVKNQISVKDVELPSILTRIKSLVRMVFGK
jgi:hypothetical protein